MNRLFCSPTQVTIEVVDGLESHEAEKGLRKERKPNWPSPNWRNWWPHSSSFPARHNEEHDHSYGANNEDSNFLRPSTDWDRRGGGKAQTEYGERTTDGERFYPIKPFTQLYKLGSTAVRKK